MSRVERERRRRRGDSEGHVNPRLVTVRPPIKDTLKEDKPPNKGQAESICVYTLYRKSPLKEDNFSIKDKWLVPKVSLLRGSTDTISFKIKL